MKRYRITVSVPELPEFIEAETYDYAEMILAFLMSEPKKFKLELTEVPELMPSISAGTII